ncbi:MULTISPECIES: HaeIII family restriction endonuclease [unclassified Bartonella]
MKPESKNKLIIIFEDGWSISFRIHNASSKVEAFLKV